MTKETITTQEMNEFVNDFKSFYDEPENKFITTDMIVNETNFLIEENNDGNYIWCGGDSDDRDTVYDNIIEEQKENK